MLLLLKVVFEPIPNLETYYFLLRAKRGGLSQVTTRYAKVKNTKSKALHKYFNDPEFDENAMTTSLYYIDCNQLYPTAMLYKLPVEDINSYQYVIRINNGLHTSISMRMRTTFRKRICRQEHKEISYILLI